MKQTVTVTTLVENSVHARGLQAEHGLSSHIQAGEQSLLFDTGQSGLLVENARKLKVPLEQIEAIALSHGHDDHTGGLEAARVAAPRARVFLHPASLAPKFAGNPDGTRRPLGMATAHAEWLRGGTAAVVWTATPTEVMDGIFVTGEIPRRNDFEDTGGRFCLDVECTRPDPLVDDQALYLDTSDGLVVLLGCGHAGVVNTLDHIGSLTGGRPIRALIGGMHLLNAGAERMEKTLAVLRRLDIQRLVPGHCTGMAAQAQLWAAFPGRCSSCGVGTRLTFQA